MKALAALADVGAAERGEWEEWTGKAFHVRRRLTEAEDDKVGESRDIRGSGEARMRVESLLRAAPHISPEQAYGEAEIMVW